MYNMELQNGHSSEIVAASAELAIPRAAVENVLTEQKIDSPKIDVLISTDDPYQQGCCMGEALRSKIEISQKRLLDYETFRQLQPWWLPEYLFLMMAQWRARTLLEPHVRQVFPEMAQRIAGMAEGSQASIDYLYLFHAMESANTASVEQAATAAACSALAVRGSRTIDHHAMIAHNFDLVADASALLSIRRNNGPSRLAYIGLSLAPMAGVIDGVNEAGLAITYNYAPTIDTMNEGPPVSFSIERALGQCTNVGDAIGLIEPLMRGGGALLMLADASGEIASLELSAGHSYVRSAEDRDLLYHTNAFQSDEMRHYEPPRNAVFGTDAPSALRGVSIFESAEARLNRFEELFCQRTNMATSAADPHPFGPQQIHQRMSDHGASNQPDANSICMHGEHWSTLAAVQIFPADRRIRVAYGPACTANFFDFQL